MRQIYEYAKMAYRNIMGSKMRSFLTMLGIIIGIGAVIMVLCIGGGICKEGETLLAPIREYIFQERYSKFCDHQTRLCVAELGNDAGVIGAACLD